MDMSHRREEEGIERKTRGRGERERRKRRRSQDSAGLVGNQGMPMFHELGVRITFHLEREGGRE